MAEYPFKRIKLSDPKIECIEGDTYRIAGKIAANCVDMADKVIVEAIIAMCKDEGVSELHLLDKNFVLNAIEKALAENKNIDPTADVVEVKHGYWLDDIQKVTTVAGVEINGFVGYRCSLCGRREPSKEPYCNCGAKMDGERRETNAE